MSLINGFAAVCNTTITSSDQCTPETCCLAQGQIQYLPSLPGNALFAAIFGLILIAQLIIGIKSKTWSFCIWVTFGLVGEIVGYVGRIMLHNNIFDFNAFLTYLIPLTIAPAFITASIYLCLARVIYVVDPALKATRLRPMTYTKIFVTFDFISLVLQAAGGGITATADNKSTSDMGINIMIAGLAFQVVSIVIFITLCADFAWRCKRSLPGRLSQTAQNDLEKRYGSSGGTSLTAIASRRLFRAFVVALAAATVLILVRSSYRLAELQDGFNGKLANDEVTFMILEGPMIIIACFLLTVTHPGLVFRGAWSMEDFARSASGPGEVLESGPGSLQELTRDVDHK